MHTMTDEAYKELVQLHTSGDAGNWLKDIVAGCTPVGDDSVVMTKEWFDKYQAAYILQEIRMGNVGKTVCRCGVEDCPDMSNLDHYRKR